MKNTLVLFLLSFTVACAQKETTPVEPIFSAYDPAIPVLDESMYDKPLTDHAKAMEHPYDVTFSIEKNAEGEHILVTDMKLHGGSFLVSPLTDAGFKGKYRVEVAPNDDLEISGAVTETPPTATVIDPHRFVNGPVNWVTKDTKYEFPLTLNSDKDFQIGGKLIFVIEPKCTLEEVPIMFKYKNGVLTVEPWKC